MSAFCEEILLKEESIFSKSSPFLFIIKYPAIKVPDDNEGRISSNENRIPESIQKELDKRRIGERFTLHKHT